MKVVSVTALFSARGPLFSTLIKRGSRRLEFRRGPGRSNDVNPTLLANHDAREGLTHSAHAN